MTTLHGPGHYSAAMFVLGLLCCFAAVCDARGAYRSLMTADKPLASVLPGNISNSVRTALPPVPKSILVLPSTNAFLSNKTAHPEEFELYPHYTYKAQGQPGTFDHRVVFHDKHNGDVISAWHDVPLEFQEKNGSYFIWAVSEIPLNTSAKFQTNTTVSCNWINQDIAFVVSNETDGNVINQTVLRFYKYKPSLVNYGGLPQTWEDSEIPDAVTGIPADNDPLDFIDIAPVPAPTGTVYRVKVLGALALIDRNETDWKILTVNAKHPLAKKYNGLHDVPQARLDELYDFFRYYKVAEGKGELKFFPPNGTAATQWVDADAAAEVVQRKYDAWKRLLAGDCKTDMCKVLSLKCGDHTRPEVTAVESKAGTVQKSKLKMTELSRKAVEGPVSEQTADELSRKAVGEPVSEEAMEESSKLTTAESSRKAVEGPVSEKSAEEMIKLKTTGLSRKAVEGPVSDKTAEEAPELEAD